MNLPRHPMPPPMQKQPGPLPRAHSTAKGTSEDPVIVRRRAGSVLRRNLPLVLAVLPAVGYGLFGFVAFLQYPGTFTPVHHTLSELGNPALNPAGSHFYRVGCVLGGTATIAFFLSLTGWRWSGTRLQNVCLGLVQALGTIAGASMVLFAVFANNESQAHLIDLGVLANSSLVLMLLSLVALRRTNRPQRLRIVTTLLASGTILLMYAIPGQHWAEWLPAFLSQAFIWLVGYEMTRWQGRLTSHSPLSLGAAVSE